MKMNRIHWNGKCIRIVRYSQKCKEMVRYMIKEKEGGRGGVEEGC